MAFFRKAYLGRTFCWKLPNESVGRRRCCIYADLGFDSSRIYGKAFATQFASSIAIYVQHYTEVL